LQRQRAHNFHPLTIRDNEATIERQFGSFFLSGRFSHLLGDESPATRHPGARARKHPVTEHETRAKASIPTQQADHPRRIARLRRSRDPRLSLEGTDPQIVDAAQRVESPRVRFSGGLNRWNAERPQERSLLNQSREQQAIARLGAGGTSRPRLAGDHFTDCNGDFSLRGYRLCGNEPATACQRCCSLPRPRNCTHSQDISAASAPDRAGHLREPFRCD